MKEKSGIWRFSGLLRLLAIALAVIYGAFFFIIWGTAIAGETELAYDLFDIESDVPLLPWQILGGIVCMGIALGATFVICWAASRFILITRSEGFFIEGAAKACRRMGYGLVVFWAGMILTENFLPWIITRGLPSDQQIEIEWFLLDLNFVALIVGLVLLLMSRAIDQARVIDADNKQII